MPDLVDNGKDVVLSLKDDLSLCNRLVGEKAAHWKLIGASLKLSMDTIRTILLDERCCRECLLSVLDSWLKDEGRKLLSQLRDAIVPFDPGFAEKLLETCISIMNAEKVKQESIGLNKVDKATSPIQFPTPQGNDALPKRCQTLIIHTFNEETMFDEVLPRSLKYVHKPSGQSSHITKSLKEFPEIIVIHQPPQPGYYHSNQYHEKQFSEIIRDYPDPDLIVMLLQSSKATDDRLIHHYTSHMGASVWQKTLVVIINIMHVQGFRRNKRHQEDTTESSRRYKINMFKKKIDTTFDQLSTPAKSRIYPNFITTSKADKAKKPKDWKKNLHDTMRETCSSSGKEGFNIMVENTQLAT